MPEVDERPLIQVRFPDGVRPVRAMIRRLGRECLAPTGGEPQLVTYEPMEMPGWLFSQSVSGDWYAVAV